MGKKKNGEKNDYKKKTVRFASTFALRCIGNMAVNSVVAQVKSMLSRQLNDNGFSMLYMDSFLKKLYISCSYRL